MNKYMITPQVDVSLVNPEDVVCEETSKFAKAFNIAAPIVGWVFGGPLTAIAIARAMNDTSVTKITTIGQLRMYKNCISPEWKHNVIYVEHPHRKNVLVEAALYKDYILREMVSDLANYISDHLDLSKLVIGLVSSGKANAKVNIPVQELNAEAAIKCNLDKNYIYSVKDTHAVYSEGRDYIWIGQFPDIISAVEHRAGSMEIRKKVNLDLDVHAGFGKAGGGGIGSKNDYEFYVTYVKAKNQF